MKKEVICVHCPIGCKINIEIISGRLAVKGYRCRVGLEYAREEFLNPKRMLTTTIVVKGGKIPLLPVRSKERLPKGILKEAINLLSKLTVNAPVKKGDIIYKNICNTGVDIIASRSVASKGRE